MITILIFILFVSGFLLHTFKRKKATVVFWLIAMVLALTTGCGLLPTLLLNYLQSQPIVEKPLWSQNNAIVILGGGAVMQPVNQKVKPTIFTYSRIHQATELYESCKQTHSICKIIISGGDPLHLGTSEAAVYENEFIRVGVIASDIIVESKSLNTYQNAQFTSNILKAHHFDNIYLVTSGIHIKRALLHFSDFNIHAIAAPSDYLSAQLFILPLGYNFAITDFAFHECLGILRLHVYNYLGWNIQVNSKGAL